MTLQLIGAGLGRTGTTSLKAALESLLGGPCYHMVEVRERPADPDVWADAYAGRGPDWATFFEGYHACVDWPAAPLWPRIAEAFPDAPILLSVRGSRHVVEERVEHDLHRTGDVHRAGRSRRRLDPDGPRHDGGVHA